MNWPVLLLFFVYVMFIITLGRYYVPKNKFIKSEWIDQTLLSVMYLMSFILFSISVCDINNEMIYAIAGSVLIIQLLWVLSISVFYKFNSAIFYSSVSFLLTAVLCQMNKDYRSIGVIPFMFTLLLQVLMSIDLQTYNEDIH